MDNIVGFVLYTILLGVILSNLYNSFDEKINMLQQKFIANSSTSLLSYNLLNFKSVEFTGERTLKPSVFNGVGEKIIYKLKDASINTSNLNSYDVLHGIRENIYGFCLKYYPEDTIFIQCKLQ